MKRRILKPIQLISLVSIIVVILFSCSKEQSMNITENEAIEIPTKSAPVFSPQFLVNSNNPYDTYGIRMEAYYTGLASILQDSRNSDYSRYEGQIDSLINVHSQILYPEVDTTDFKEYENSFINGFLNSVNASNIKAVSLYYENLILNDTIISNDQEERLLEMISILKFSGYYDSVILGPTVWEQDFHTCVVGTLNNIFEDDGNPFPELGYIFGLPESWLFIAAGCAYEATFLTNPN